MFKLWWLQWKAKRASIKLEKSRAKVLESHPRDVAGRLAELNPDGIPADEALERARAAADPFVSLIVYDLPLSEQREVSVSIARKVLELAELRDGRYYFPSPAP